MSQFAFYMHKKQIGGSVEVISNCKEHNGPELTSVFNIDFANTYIHKVLLIVYRLLINKKYGYINKIIVFLFKLFKVSVIYESDYAFNKKYLINSTGINFYYGGWHCDKYFVKNKGDVVSYFNFEITGDSIIKNIVNEIRQKNSVSVHVRRGDYLNGSTADFLGGVCTKKYYEKAFDIIQSKVKSPHYFIFSDDMVWVKNNIIKENATYVDCNCGTDSWRDMYLMSLCAHNIISNSTFSWWGAWLNINSNNITVCPYRFTKNDTETEVYPDNWHRIYEY